MNYDIVPSSIRHVRPMAKHLRTAACITLQGFGFNPREALRRAYVASFYCRTALMDGKPAAMWGVTGTMLSESAFVWLVLSEEIARFPLAVTREAKAELHKIMQNYSEVHTTVLPDDEAAVRFAVWLGFHDRHGGPALPRRELQREILTDPRYRIAVGDQFVIGLGYHPKETL